MPRPTMQHDNDAMAQWMAFTFIYRVWRGSSAAQTAFWFMLEHNSGYNGWQTLASTQVLELRGTLKNYTHRCHLHEFGHVVVLPLLDTIQHWCQYEEQVLGLTAGIWNNNVTPAHLTPYTKVKVYGWATATVLSSAATISVQCRG